MAQQATDTFVAELDTGQMLVQKGTILPNSHPVVKLHGKSALFTTVDLGENEEPAKRPRGRPRKNPAVVEAGDDGNGDEGE